MLNLMREWEYSQTLLKLAAPPSLHRLRQSVSKTNQMLWQNRRDRLCNSNQHRQLRVRLSCSSSPDSRIDTSCMVTSCSFEWSVTRTGTLYVLCGKVLSRIM